MTHLDKLENISIYVLREAFYAFDKPAMLWSLGKDSNVMVHLAHKAFFGRIPFPLVHVDTGKKFREMYDFRTTYAKKWNAELIIGDCPPVEDVDPTLPPAARSAARKTEGLNALVKKYGFDALFAGIRRDEQATRAKERFFSPRSNEGNWDVKFQPPELWDQFNTQYPPGVHVRVHPLLSWAEVDIWRYVEREKIPLVSLYYAKNGKRYRSLGDTDLTNPIDSDAATVAEIIKELETTKAPERAGRTMDHEREDSFEQLRAKGYM